MRLTDLRFVPGHKHGGQQRPWTTITGVTLHQTACVLGEDPNRWLTCGAHFGVTRGGDVFWLHPIECRTVHAHKLNATTVGIELDGHYSGIAGDQSTYWKPKGSRRVPLHPTPELVASAIQTIRWISAELTFYGGALRYLYAHRQASADRQSDPGSEIWKAVALPAMAELRLTAGPKDFTLGDGLPIPEAWDPRCQGVPY